MRTKKHAGKKSLICALFHSPTHDCISTSIYSSRSRMLNLRKTSNKLSVFPRPSLTGSEKLPDTSWAHLFAAGVIWRHVFKRLESRPSRISLLPPSHPLSLHWADNPLHFVAGYFSVGSAFRHGAANVTRVRAREISQASNSFRPWYLCHVRSLGWNSGSWTTATLLVRHRVPSGTFLCPVFARSRRENSLNYTVSTIVVYTLKCTAGPTFQETEKTYNARARSACEKK